MSGLIPIKDFLGGIDDYIGPGSECVKRIFGEPEPFIELYREKQLIGASRVSSVEWYYQATGEIILHVPTLGFHMLRHLDQQDTPTHPYELARMAAGKAVVGDIAQSILYWMSELYMDEKVGAPSIVRTVGDVSKTQDEMGAEHTRAHPHLHGLPYEIRSLEGLAVVLVYGVPDPSVDPRYGEVDESMGFVRGVAGKKPDERLH